MSEFTPEHRGCYSIGLTVAGTKYKKLYKLVETTPDNLSLADKVVFEDDFGQIITFNGNVVQVVTDVHIDNDGVSTKIDTVPYQLNNVYSTTGFPPFQ